MAQPPETAESLGPRTLVPKPVRGLDFKQLKLTSIEGFVLSRVDGHLTLGEIYAVTSLPDTASILRRLAEMGLVEIPGVAARPKPVAGRPATPPASAAPSAESSRRAAASAPPRETPSPAAASAPSAAASAAASHTDQLLANAPIDAAILAEDVELDVERRRQVLAMHACLPSLNHFTLLGVPPTATKQEIKRAYFRLSKVFHPDQYFRKRLGSYLQRLEEVFNRLALAFEILGDDTKRAAYLASLAEAEGTAEATTHVEPASSVTTPVVVPAKAVAHSTLSADERARGTARELSRLAAEEYIPELKRARQCFLEGQEHMAAGRLNAAMSRIKMAIALEPDNVAFRQAFEVVGELCRRRGVVQNASATRAELEEAKGGYEAAARLYLAASKETGASHYVARAARMLLCAGQLQRAREFAITAVDKCPENAEVHFILGLIYKALKLPAASDTFRKALQLDPSHDGARAELEELAAKK